MQQFSILDRLIIQTDRMVKTLTNSLAASRPYPGSMPQQQELSSTDRATSIALMRINHSGEIAAQALYAGQAIFSKNEDLQYTLMQAADEEIDHLAWCQQRLNELGGHSSYLNLGWYLGAFFIGAFAGLIGDRVSLGFLAETEHQVEQHLKDHLTSLSEHDLKSRAIVAVMREDEAQHAHIAEQSGAIALLPPIPLIMKLTAKVMTRSAYWI